MTIWWGLSELHPMLIRQMHRRICNVLSKDCIWRWNNQMHWRVFEFCQRIASDAETVRCIDKFRFCQKVAPDVKTIRCTDKFPSLCSLSNCKTASYWRYQKCCTQRWNGRMHWQIFDVIRKTALWWSNALTIFLCICQRTAFNAETIECIENFSILSKSWIWRWND